MPTCRMPRRTITMHEIATELEGRIDYLFVSTSTCGTLRGCAEYVRDHHLSTKIFAVDAHGSVISGGRRCRAGSTAPNRP